jgi:hypothetical protein
LVRPAEAAPTAISAATVAVVSVLVVTLFEERGRDAIPAAAIIALALVAAAVAAVERRTVVAGLVPRVYVVVAAEWTERWATLVAVLQHLPTVVVQDTVVTNLAGICEHHAIAAFGGDAATLPGHTHTGHPRVAGSRDCAFRAVQARERHMEDWVQSIARPVVVAAVQRADVLIVENGQRPTRTHQVDTALFAVA